MREAGPVVLAVAGFSAVAGACGWLAGWPYALAAGGAFSVLVAIDWRAAR